MSITTLRTQAACLRVQYWGLIQNNHVYCMELCHYWTWLWKELIAIDRISSMTSRSMGDIYWTGIKFVFLIGSVQPSLPPHATYPYPLTHFIHTHKNAPRIHTPVWAGVNHSVKRWSSRFHVTSSRIYAPRWKLDIMLSPLMLLTFGSHQLMSHGPCIEITWRVVYYCAKLLMSIHR